MREVEQRLKQVIRSIPDYPTKGVMFRDLTPIWKDGKLLRETVDILTEHAKKLRPDKIVGIEARGFIVGSPIAYNLSVGFVPSRKLGKLPYKKLSIDYELEYGRQGLEIHSDGIKKGEGVIIVDDLLATGGTSDAARKLVERLGGKVLGFEFIVELSYLRGRERLKDYDVFSIVRYEE